MAYLAESFSHSSQFDPQVYVQEEEEEYSFQRPAEEELAVANVTPWWIDDLTPQLSHVHTHTHTTHHQNGHKQTETFSVSAALCSRMSTYNGGLNFSLSPSFALSHVQVLLPWQQSQQGEEDVFRAIRRETEWDRGKEQDPGMEQVEKSKQTNDILGIWKQLVPWWRPLSGWSCLNRARRVQSRVQTLLLFKLVQRVSIYSLV